MGYLWTTLSPSIGSNLWNQNPWPFPTQQHPNHNLLHKLSHKPSKQSLNYPKRVPNIPTIQSQVFGIDQTAIHGLKHSKSFTKHLKPKITEYEKTPTSWSFQNSTKPVPTGSPCRLEQLCFLARCEQVVR